MKLMATILISALIGWVIGYNVGIENKDKDEFEEW